METKLVNSRGYTYLYKFWIYDNVYMTYVVMIIAVEQLCKGIRNLLVSLWCVYLFYLYGLLTNNLCSSLHVWRWWKIIPTGVLSSNVIYLDHTLMCHMHLSILNEQTLWFSEGRDTPHTWQKSTINMYQKVTSWRHGI